MATPAQTYRAEETLELIDAKAKANPERALFYVKIARKAPNGLIPQQVAAFTNATLDHLGDPARWLMQLGGGGEYVLRVSHVDSQHQDIGGPLYFSLSTVAPSGVPTRAIDASATFRPEWSGPPTMVMPSPIAPSLGLPPAIRNMVFSGTQYGDAETLAAANAQAQQNPATDLARREREFAEKEAALRKELAEKESKIRDDRLLATIDAKNRELDAKLQRITELQSQPRREESSSSWVKELVGSMVPLVTQMMTSQHEIRMLMMKQSETQSTAQMAAAERSHQQMLEFMKAAATPKQSGMSEEMRMLINMVEKEKSSNGADAMAAMTMRLVDAMGMVTKNSISMMEAVAELNASPEEHPAVAAIREGVKAIGMMSAGMREGARKMIPQQQQQPRMAAPPQQPRPQPRPAQPRPNGVPPNQPQQPAPQQTQPLQQAQPSAQVAVVDFPQAVPAPVVAVAPTPQPTEMRPLPIDVLENGIRQLAPIEEVAKYFVALCKDKDPSLFAALDDPECDGDPDKVIIKKLGTDFVLANQEYLEALSDEIDRQGEAAGVVQHDEEQTEPEQTEETSAEIVAEVQHASDVVVQVPRS